MREEGYSSDSLGPTRFVGPEALRKAREPLPKDEATEAVITVEIRAGQLLTDSRGDQYVIKKKLGEGGMGGVFEMEEMRTGMIHAVKFMNSRHRKTPAYIKRFEREIKVLARMQNPFILAAHDVIRFDIDGEEVVGFVTDFVEGPNLEEEIPKEGYMPFERIALLAGQMAIALETLREEGIVHRDLKPQNVFLQEMSRRKGQTQAEQFVRIGDFGIVGFAFASEKPTQDDGLFATLQQDDKLTREGYTVGTPAYMSPEAVQNKSVDHRSDLYSLGAVMYQMISGHVPFSGKPADVLTAQIRRIPFPMTRENEDVPEWLEDIVTTLLQKDPDARFQSAGEVFQALKAGVAEDYPELLKEIPFIWDIKPSSYDTSIRRAA